MILTKETFAALILRQDTVGMHAIGRALVHLRNRQTNDEVRVQETKWHNERGFRPCHARMGTSMASYYERNQMLTLKQQNYWRRKIGKSTFPCLSIYWKQLAEEAAKKQGVPA
jgi:hypothetical protein